MTVARSATASLFIPLCLALLVGPARADVADKPGAQRLGLAQLIALARTTYPGIEAARQSQRAMEYQLYRARWATLPRGSVTGSLTPATSIACADEQGKPSVERCITTTSFDVGNLKFGGGVFTRLQVDFVLPVLTFGKINSLVRAARAGVAARRAQVEGAREDVVVKVVRAYWGYKLAREILYTIDEGKAYLDKALAKIAKQLETGDGDATVSDQLKLRTLVAEVEARTHEAKKLESLTRIGLATLTGIPDRALQVDEKVIAPLVAALEPMKTYVDRARGERPELRALAGAAKARQAQAEHERAKLFPDLAIFGGVGFAHNPFVDQPRNAFYSNPHNGFGFGVGLALRWDINAVGQYGAYKSAQAVAAEMKARKDEGSIGVSFQVKESYLNLREAMGRMDASRKGQKSARRWLVSVSQNIDGGLVGPRDVNDPLRVFFDMRLRFLRAMFDVNVGWAVLGRAIGDASTSQFNRKTGDTATGG